MARAKFNADHLLGMTLGEKYHLVSVIGHGGMGVVCEARHVNLGKRFAVKLMNKAVPRPDIIAARFRREVRAISAIESENIVQVFDVGVDPKLGLYMVMEFLPGEDLAMRLARETQIAPAEVIALGYQIARGLAKAHEVRIIHRDLKPANIFLIKRDDGSDQVKLLDFGVAKLLDGEGGDTWVGDLTTIGMSVGTPQYMSPEQAQGLELDERTDVWSLGVVLYEMLSGRPAYEAEARAHQTIVKVVTQKPAPLSEIAPWVPARLASIVHAALQHDRHFRIPSCSRFADFLAEAAEGRPPSRDVGFESAETVVAKNPVPELPAPRPVSSPSGFINVRDTLTPLPPVRRKTRATWPAVLLLTATAALAGHLGATRAAILGASVGPRPAAVRLTAAAAPVAAFWRNDFSPRVPR